MNDLVIPLTNQEQVDALRSDDDQCFIQWKGTDICMDWTCPTCGERQHVDGYFCYALQCASCNQFCHVGTTVVLTPISEDVGRSGSFCRGMDDDE